MGNVVVEATGTALTSMEGIDIREAATNVLLQNRDFDTTWTVNGTPTTSQDVTGIDGVANTAWTWRS